MKIVVFTLQYPYAGGESFLEDEIEILSKKFSEIIVISRALSDTIIRKVPQNIHIIRCFDGISKAKHFFYKVCSIAELCTAKTLKELIFSKKHYNNGSIPIIYHRVYLYYLTKRLFNDAIHQIMEEERTEDYIFYSYWLNELSYSAVQFGEQYDIPSISRAHRTDYVIENYNPFRREIIRRLNCIFAISETAIMDIKKYYFPYTKGKTCDIELARLGILKNNDICSELLPIDDTMHIVSCSTLIPRKRVELIVDALSSINDLKLEWTHFGAARNGHKVEEYAHSMLSNKSNITFDFKGYVDKSEILKYYEDNSIDLLINSSDSEGVPVSIMEAFAYGIPCIARDVGGNAEIVNTQVGYIVRSNADGSDISECIREYSKLTFDDKMKMRVNAYNKYLDMCDAKKNYSRFANTLMLRFSQFSDTIGGAKTDE